MTANTLSNPVPLWQPSDKQISAANLTFFKAYLNQQYGIELDSYHSFHQWSISNKEQFWSAIWDYFKVIGTRSNAVLEGGDMMPGAQWFSGSDLNFAENLLKNRSEDIAIIERGEDGRKNNVSYRELNESVAQLAAWMKQNGVRSGDRVAAFLPNSQYAIVGMLATASLGAVWSSCSPDFGLNGVLDRFQQIKPKILIATTGYFYSGKTIDTLKRVRDVARSLPELRACLLADYLKQSTSSPSIDNEAAKSTPLTHWKDVVHSDLPVPALSFTSVSFDAPLYILYSSGTTGKPKCIVHSVGGTLLQHVKELALHTNINAGDRVFYFTTCGWMMWNWLISSLALEACVVLFDGSPFSPKQDILFDIADEEAISVFGASAKYYAACEKYGLVPRESHQLVNLRTLLSTGSPLSHEGFDYLYQKVKSDVCVSSISGGTDIVSCFALGCPTLPVYKGELQCSGLGMDLAFFDDEGDSLESGKGELVCKSPFPSMPTAFWSDEKGEKYREAYFETFQNIWAHGDYGEFINHKVNGELVQRGVIIHGRSDAILNPGGVRIGTAEIYRQVEKINSVFESIAVGQKWQDDVRIVLFVRLQEGLSLTDKIREQIKQTIRNNTTPRHVPNKIIQIADIPRTLSGKIVELAVRKVIHGEEVKNTEALANPEALNLYKNIKELKT